MLRRIMALLFLSVSLYGCSKEGFARFFMDMKDMKPKSGFSTGLIPPPPDYSDSSSWFVIENKGQAVDIFYLHPTTYMKSDNWNQDVGDTAANKFTMHDATIRSQMSVFRGIGNFYMPKYRQATAYAFMDKENNGEKALKLAYTDVERAFYHYLEHFNHGRPFIIEAHSQGSMHILHLLPELFKDANIRSKIIAVYALGWPVTLEYLKAHPEISFCQDSCQTGCLIGWLTESQRPVYTIVKEPSKAVNPLTWKTNDDPAPARLNKGAVLFFDDRMDTVLHYVSARVDNGVVRVSKPHTKKLYTPFMRGNYHMYDYSFFYMNLRQNALERIQCYKRKSGLLN